MNDQSLNQNDKPVKPCRKCGATDRGPSGNCRPCQKQAVLRYQNNNPDKVKDTAKKYYYKNRESRIASAYLWNKENPERFRKNHNASQKKWNKNNSHKVRQYRNTRRARAKAGGKLSSNIIDVLLVRQRGKCACCNKPLNGEYHLDHIMPLALGGTNTDDNVQLLLPKCNRRKGAKHPIDYMREKGRLL